MENFIEEPGAEMTEWENGGPDTDTDTDTPDDDNGEDAQNPCGKDEVWDPILQQCVPRPE